MKNMALTFEKLNIFSKHDFNAKGTLNILFFQKYSRMASLVVAGTIIFVIILFAKRNPQLVPLQTLSEAQLHGHKIASGHNRKPQITPTCSCPYGFTAKPNTDKIGSNNFLSCSCSQGGPANWTKSTFQKGKNVHTYKNCPDASHGSCYNYNRKMAMIQNPNEKYLGEPIGHLKMINQLNKPKKCSSVIGFTPKPRCGSCHSVTSSGKIDNAGRFYNF